jgi:hypothetical protein
MGKINLIPIAILLFMLLSPVALSDIQDFDLYSPYNNTGTNQSQPTFSFFPLLNGSSGSLDCELLINGTGYGKNSSVLNSTETSITSNSSFSDGLYRWGVNCTTNDSVNYESFNRSFFVDTESPSTVEFVSPSPDNGESFQLTNANYRIPINVSFSDNLEVRFCTLIRNTNNYTMIVGNGFCYINFPHWTEGSNTIKVRVFDVGGNYNETPERTITVDVLTRSDINSLYFLFPIILVAIAVIAGLGIFAIYDEIEIETAMKVLIGMLVACAFAGILISMGGVVI